MEEQTPFLRMWSRYWQKRGWSSGVDSGSFYLNSASKKPSHLTEAIKPEENKKKNRTRMISQTASHRVKRQKYIFHHIHGKRKNSFLYINLSLCLPSWRRGHAADLWSYTDVARPVTCHMNPHIAAMVRWAEWSYVVTVVEGGFRQHPNGPVYLLIWSILIYFLDTIFGVCVVEKPPLSYVILIPFF